MSKNELLPVGTNVRCRFAGDVWDTCLLESDENPNQHYVYRVTSPFGDPVWLAINEVEELKND